MNNFLKVAIVGRPNVGKSTLFNRLSCSSSNTGGKREGLKIKNIAITKNEEGITRDYITSPGRLLNLPILLYDTAGLIPHNPLANQEPFFEQIQQHVVEVITSCNIVFFICDITQGVTEYDIQFSRWLHKICPQDNILLLANKADHSKNISSFQSGKLWAKEFFPISAQHYLGFNELHDHIVKHFNLPTPTL